MTWQVRWNRACGRVLFESQQTLFKARAFLRKDGFRAYWFWRCNNFGDLLTPMLIRHFGRSPVYCPPRLAHFVGSGSILEHLDPSFQGTIVGSGFLHEKSRMFFPNARILGVRGILTRERLGQQHKRAFLGDPGLLAVDVLRQKLKKRWALGIIIHYADRANPQWKRLHHADSNNLKMISVQQHPLKVIREIAQCEHIVSSSLHGLIVADSLGMPSAWIPCCCLDGAYFKFYDYYSSIEVSDPRPYSISKDASVSQLCNITNHKPREPILKIQDGLRRLWQDALKEELRS